LAKLRSASPRQALPNRARNPPEKPRVPTWRGDKFRVKENRKKKRSVRGKGMTFQGMKIRLGGGGRPVLGRGGASGGTLLGGTELAPILQGDRKPFTNYHQRTFRPGPSTGGLIREPLPRAKLPGTDDQSSRNGGQRRGDFIVTKHSAKERKSQLANDGEFFTPRSIETSPYQES